MNSSKNQAPRFLTYKFVGESRSFLEHVLFDVSEHGESVVLLEIQSEEELDQLLIMLVIRLIPLQVLFFWAPAWFSKGGRVEQGGKGGFLLREFVKLQEYHQLWQLYLPDFDVQVLQEGIQLSFPFVQGGNRLDFEEGSGRELQKAD